MRTSPALYRLHVHDDDAAERRIRVRLQPEGIDGRDRPAGVEDHQNPTLRAAGEVGTREESWPAGGVDNLIEGATGT